MEFDITHTWKKKYLQMNLSQLGFLREDFLLFCLNVLVFIYLG